MPKNKSAVKRPSEPYGKLSKELLLSKAFLSLSGAALKLLLYLLAHYNGFNNGSLYACWPIMQRHGWRSEETLSRAIKQLIEAGFVVKTRQGGRNKITLLALTFEPIDECRIKGGIYDAGITIGERSWKNEDETQESATCESLAEAFGDYDDDAEF